MNGTRPFMSSEYPVVYAVEAPPPGMIGGMGLLSLALLVEGIPSFLATVPVNGEVLAGVRDSLDAGPVRIAVQGISVEPNEVAGAEVKDDDEAEPWASSWEAEAKTEGETLPGAYLSLVCADGRRLGVARIVSRERRASPEEVARFVLRQIQSGVQVSDLASTN